MMPKSKMDFRSCVFSVSLKKWMDITGKIPKIGNEPLDSVLFDAKNKRRLIRSNGCIIVVIHRESSIYPSYRFRVLTNLCPFPERCHWAKWWPTK